MNTQNIIWGVGLRPAHYSDWHTQTKIPALEIMADNLLHHRGGPALWHTKRIVDRAALCVLHGVGINIGGLSPLSTKYLGGLKDLIQIFKPRVVSDHLCFTQARGIQSYELLPLMRTKKAIEHASARIDRIQQALGVRFSIENVSAYVNYKDDAFPEGEFVSEIAQRSGCGILLDVNNVYVSAMNFNLNPEDEIKRFDLNAVTQIHVAGHSTRDDFLFDTHDSAVCAEVWELLKKTLGSLRFSENKILPIILENDERNTSLKTLLDELKNGSQFCGEGISIGQPPHSSGESHV
ncbi:MAG: DUF692 domain-containing protein [Betaproteobacteria bacterium]|nr:DUF692 domain-containing protein [Betaproteobacteria bacterium]